MDWNGEISPDVVRVLPSVCHNLRGLGYEHPLFPRFMGIDRKIWVENQKVKKYLTEWLPGFGKELGDDRVSFLVLPPTSFIFDNALRYPVYRSHLRFAVSSAVDAARGIGALLDQGWIPNDGLVLPKRWLEGVVWGMDHLGMHRGEGEWLSLTWRTETWFGSRWKEVWEGAEEIRFGDKTVLVMGATDSMEFVLRQKGCGESFRWLTHVLMMQTKEVVWGELRARLRESPLRSEAAELVRLVEEITDFSILPEVGHPEVGFTDGCGIQADAGGARVRLLRRLKMAWKRFRGSLPEGTSGVRALGQFPGYVIARWHVGHRMRKRWRSGGEG